MGRRSTHVDKVAGIRILIDETRHAQTCAEERRVELTDDPETQQQVARALEIFCNKGTLFMAGADRHFIRVRTEDIGDRASDESRESMGVLTTGTNKMRQLRLGEPTRNDYGEPFTITGVTGKKRQVRHSKFELGVDDFVSACKAYGVKIGEALKAQIAALPQRPHGAARAI